MAQRPCPLERVVVGEHAAHIREVALSSTTAYRGEVWDSMHKVFIQITDLSGLTELLGSLGFPTNQKTLRHVIIADESQRRGRASRFLCIALARLYPDKVGMDVNSAEYEYLCKIIVHSSELPAASAISADAAEFVPNRPVRCVTYSSFELISNLCSKFSDAECREIIRRFIAAKFMSMHHFCNSNEINSERFKVWIDNTSESYAQATSVISWMMAIIFSNDYSITMTSISRENVSRVPQIMQLNRLTGQIHDHGALQEHRNSMRLKANIDNKSFISQKLYLTTHAMPNITNELSSVLDPGEIAKLQQDNKTMIENCVSESASVEAIIFIDGDRCTDCIYNLPQFFTDQWSVRVFVFVNPISLARNPNWALWPSHYLHISVTMIMTKDSADTVMSMHVGLMHAKMPAHVPFIFLSNDKFAMSCVETTRFWGRQAGYVYHPIESLIFYLMKFMPNLRCWKPTARELVAVIAPIMDDYYERSGEVLTDGQYSDVTSCANSFYNEINRKTIRDVVATSQFNLSEAAQHLLTKELIR